MQGKKRGLGKRERVRQCLGQELELEITGMSTRGWGRSQFLWEGKLLDVEVQGAVLGDRVLAQLCRVEALSFQARVVEFLAYGYARRGLRCPHAALRVDKDSGCGGCALQSLAYADQLEVKAQLLRQALSKEGITQQPMEILGCEEQWYYRNKMELSFGPDGADALGLGLHPYGYKHEVISLQACHLLSPLLAELVQKTITWAQEAGLRYFVFRKNQGFLRLLTLRRSQRTGKQMLILTSSHEGQIEFRAQSCSAEAVIEDYVAKVLSGLSQRLDSFYWSAIIAKKGERTRIEDRLIFGERVLQELMYLPDAEHALSFEILPQAFFQPNSRQAERLYQQVIGLAQPYLSTGARVLDLYCGTGTIALSFARHGYRVLAIDIEAQAIENARANAERNGLTALTEFYVGDTAEILNQLSEAGQDLSSAVIVVDPPRRGLLPPALKQLLKLQAKAIVYISCNPETLARDLRLFIDRGYLLLSVQGVDMLPQTAHLESLALLELPA